MTTQTVTKEWKTAPLGDICEILNGYAFKSDDYSDSGYRVIRIQNVQDGYIRTTNDRFIPKEKLIGAERFILNAGDLLISLTGQVGRVGILQKNDLPAVLNQRVAKVIPKDADLQFLYFLYRYRPIQKEIEGNAFGAIQQNVSTKSILKIEVRIPSFPEQKAIAQTLTTVQDAIAAQEALIAKLKELKRSMMQHLFTHGTKGEKTKMTEIGEIPESWDVTTVGNVCDVKGGKRLPKGEKLVSTDTGFPYIRVTDLSENSVDLSDIHYITPEVQKTISRYVISTKDIYISIAGSIGFVGTIPQELDGANLTENAAKLCIKSDLVDQRFLMYWLASDYVQRDIKSQTVKNAQPKLALARIQQLTCVLPSIVEQKHIAYTVDSIVDRIRVTEMKLAILQNLFKTLLHELMSGERRLTANI